jgi:hypothetical protein
MKVIFRFSVELRCVQIFKVKLINREIVSEATNCVCCTFVC